MADQRAFAAVSGDHNPMHLDPQLARRLMLGGVAVHGVHLVLWALENVVAAREGIQALASVRARFERPVSLEQQVALEWQLEGSRITATLSGEAGRLMRLRAETSVADPPWQGIAWVPPSRCEEHDMDALVGAAGHIPLALPADFARIFPHLAGGFSPRQLAILLASTRLVGMICPGLHSIFSALSLNFTPNVAAGDTMTHAVTRADARLGLVDIALAAPGLHGSLQTLLRPKPVHQPGFTELRAMVTPDMFAGQRALVIGGARGLGELTAKLLASGGANVTLTYLLGADDAARITAEAASQGLRVTAMKFDIARPPDDFAIPKAGYTHAYYFATPRILPGKAGGFSPASFARYVEYYVTGLARCVEWLRPRSATDLCLWYPSTVFVDSAPPGLAEYAAAKACGEALCAQLRERLAPLRLVVERLPRLATDQTQSLARTEMDDAATVLRTVLLKLR